MASSVCPTHGLRVLVVEDNLLAAEVLRDLLESSGCTVVGPAAYVDDGLKLAREETLDGALLDINLNGERCFPIAEVLRGRGVPFMFLTGYDDGSMIPDELRPARRLGKLVPDHVLIEAVGEAFVSRS